MRAVHARPGGSRRYKSGDLGKLTKAVYPLPRGGWVLEYTANRGTFWDGSGMKELGTGS